MKIQEKYLEALKQKINTIDIKNLRNNNCYLH